MTERCIICGETEDDPREYHYGTPTPVHAFLPLSKVGQAGAIDRGQLLIALRNRRYIIEKEQLGPDRIREVTDIIEMVEAWKEPALEIDAPVT